MRARCVLLVSSAVVFASVDLLHKTFDPAQFHNDRTPFATFVMVAIVAGLVLLVPRIPSNAAALGAGIACGGALGNFFSLLAWSQGVPDPLVLAGATHGVAFNLADVFALGGDALLLSAAAVYGMRNRGLLRERV